MNLFCEIVDMVSESDVEQKLIIPILTNAEPLGLGYKSMDYKTKISIKQLQIDKGNASKLYYPDYVVILLGLPVMIIEAKKPGEDLEEALREARLYAHEINASFGHGINPCQKIIAINGEQLLASDWDSVIPEIRISHNQMNVSDIAYGKFVEFCNKQNLLKAASIMIKNIRGGKRFVKPTLMLGGRTVQNEELPQNSFGSNLSLELRNVFNPDTEGDRVDIVKNAYVTSKKRQKHVAPIDKIIRAASTPSISSANFIEDISKPGELINVFNRNISLRGELLLLIGSVGSGKSTFIDFLKEVALPGDVRLRTEWVSLNLNNAPLSRDLIYDWVKEGITEQIKKNHPNDDFDSLDTLLKIHSAEVKKLEKGPTILFGRESEEFKRALASMLIKLTESKDETLKSIVNYFCSDKKLLIVVLDNCDRRNKEDQLLMFDIATWLKSYLNCLVFLPMRDTTFDHHRKEKPLDTVIKDLVYRIDPPSLMQVLHKRIAYALRIMPDEGAMRTYELENIRIEYPSSDLGNYLASIMHSLFQNNFFQRIITGIAGRDIRRGIEMFMDFCKSGHIDEREIFKMTQTGGEHEMPYSTICRVIFRGNRKYYNDANSIVKNIFNSETSDPLPNPFTRLVLLQWLKDNFRKQGPNGSLGYHKISTVIGDLLPLGFAENRLQSELMILIQNKCIMTESQSFEQDDENELISIAPAGQVHLDLLNNVDYLAACSEDVWYNDAGIADKISQRLIGKKGNSHFSKTDAIDVSRMLIDYLYKYKEFLPANPGLFIQKINDNLYEGMQIAKDSLDLAVYKDTTYFDREQLIKDFPVGTVIEAQVVSLQNYGAFVHFGLYGSGLLHISGFSSRHLHSKVSLDDLEIGDWVNVKIKGYNHAHKRFDISLADL